ncbi:membrane-associated Zn-dependent protease 1, partial [mine drainage metagenome]
MRFEMLNYIILALALVMIWILAMVILAPYISKTRHFALLGPALMIKATKNRKILDRVSMVIPRESFSKISVALVMVFSVLAIALLLYEAYLSVFIRVAPSTSVGH